MMVEAHDPSCNCSDCQAIRAYEYRVWAKGFMAGLKEAAIAAIHNTQSYDPPRDAWEGGFVTGQKSASETISILRIPEDIGSSGKPVTTDAQMKEWTKLIGVGNTRA